ncbi:MAG: alpha/beta fold hydrolase [Thermoleophilia bacterium]|jgi:2-succinyl-6-hydroxy-2,4-cyclohexadiene-1-carboxylate synthase|nr:alpha/beta fold hydrolase [Thermoleophilia bacterium]
MEERLLAGMRCLVWRRPGVGRMALLHGFTGHPASWEPVVDALAAPGLVVAPFLPGHDPEAPRTSQHGFEEVVDALAAALGALHPGPWRLAGYSLGARVALGLLVRAPELWADAVLIGVNPGIEDEASRRTRLAEDARRAGVLRERGVVAFVEEWERLPLLATQAELPAAATAAQRARRLAHDAEGLARSLEVLGLGAMPNCWPALPGIQVPVWVVVGERDQRFAPLAARAAGLLPAGELVVVPGVGHNVVLEAPGAVSALLEGGGARYLQAHGEDP